MLLVMVGCSTSGSSPPSDPPQDAGVDASSTGSSDPFLQSLVVQQKPILWIAAHPDDELEYPPVGGELGAENGLPLQFLIATRGEKTTLCYVASGCPDIAAMRAVEMQKAADGIGGRPSTVVKMRLPDGTNGFESTKDPRAWW